MKQRLSRDTYARIQDGLRARMEAQGLDGLLVDDHHHVAYLTGFFHFPNERPAAVWLTAEECVLLVPALEADHAEKQNTAADFVVYPEFPGLEDAFSILLSTKNPTGRIAYSPTTPVGRVEKFRRFAPNATWVMSEIVEDARLIKFPEEIALHREAARISDAMVESGLKLIRDAMAAGSPLPTEAELASHVTRFGVSTMYAEHEDVVVGQMLAGGLVYTGKNAAFPHGLPSAERVKPGETFILSLGCAVGGRFAESERTFVMGEPSDEQRRYFDVAARAQAVGTDALIAGRPCSEANRICLDVIREAGMEQFLRHRQGHGIGIWLHEPPWIADGDDSPLLPGMIVSSEPGLYIPGHGGYRISDTVLITENGPERLTKRPRTLQDCVIG
ncbi:Xaa-Pro aminopeptidase [Youhaiella tibetensis]|uniref:Aminopeptidase P family protein n=1 Tax=Paradevosia tibetensis TaxID=1447062 RepID=A0A5B9DJN3_9HYPH|nr:Xaa-Pro peptidase family protein [Youhaiella tibetensis]QEE19236.1 aminopeptidase P family protein [Youhaiella tibetensis]GGF35002.1 Xaa-Pro aminopeptidase [Youhaiella tibetensis]